MRQVFRMLTAVVVVITTWVGTLFLWYVLTSHDPEYQSRGVPPFVPILGFALGLGAASFLTRERPRKRPGLPSHLPNAEQPAETPGQSGDSP